MRANLGAVRADRSRYTIHHATAAEVLDLRPCPIGDAGIVFADPPYAADIEAGFLRRVRLDQFTELAVVIVERRTKAAVSAPGGMQIERERRFGDTTLTYFVPVA